VFRNPVLDDDHLKKLIKENPELESISKDNTIPAGWFIEALGLKGKKIGGAMVSEKHGNFIVNTGNAKAEDVAILISLIKQKVRDDFEVQLREEIEYVGFGDFCIIILFYFSIAVLLDCFCNLTFLAFSN